MQEDKCSLEFSIVNALPYFLGVFLLLVWLFPDILALNLHDFFHHRVSLVLSLKESAQYRSLSTSIAGFSPLWDSTYFNRAFFKKV